jgi:hypothetical protein
MISIQLMKTKALKTKPANQKQAGLNQRGLSSAPVQIQGEPQPGRLQEDTG